MDEDTARSRINSQMPQTERVQHADVVLENAGSLEELSAKIQDLWNSRVLTR
jgi:dephospho-CoA kinase